MGQITGVQSVRSLFAIFLSTVLCSCSSANGVQLDVPLVQQAEGRLCGPAAIEMIFRFWGEDDHDQYAIARQIATEYSSEARFKNNAFAWIKNHLDQGVPVIIHQYWATTTSTGHYRVVTGYDDNKKLVYLNDAKAGRIEQTYNEFKKKGAFPGEWMPYYSIAFKSDR